MGNTKPVRFEFNWQSTTPIPFRVNSVPTGVVNGVMTGTNTIYSNIIDLTNYANIGMELTWTGTPTGTISVMCSSSGVNFYALSNYSQTPTQPAGSAGGYLINFNQIPFKYMFIQYVNSTGSGILNVWVQNKDVN